MPRLEDDSLEIARIDEVLGEWRQGDIAPDIDWFVHVGDPADRRLRSRAAGAVMDGRASDDGASTVPYEELRRRLRSSR